MKYASDPYWGEKAANVAYALDAAQGSQDYGQYTIGVKDTLASSHQTVNVRNASSTSSTVLYSTGSASNYSVLIKDSTLENGFYRIQSDGVLDSGRTSVVRGSGAYSFDAMYAYISSDYVQIVNQGTAVSEPEPEPQPEPEPEPVPATLDSISIAAAPQKTVYTEGETFDPTGMTVQANWSDGSVTDVTGEVSYRTDPLTTDVTAVEISYTSGDVTRTVSQSIQVNAKVTVTGVLINPSEISLYPGDAKTFGVSVQGTGDPSQSVTWSVEGASSSQTVIDENGRLTVGEDETAGQLTVKAQSAADGSQIGQAAVTVVPKESEEPSAPDGAGGSEEYASADLKDETSGIGVNGEFAENTSLTVTPIGSDSEEYQALVKEAAGKTILGVYELSLDGAVKDGSKIQVTFAVDEQYNGQSILILHYPKADDVTYIERYVATAQDGTVTVEVDSLSPFVIALDEESAGNDASGGQTPEGDEPEVTDEPENSEEPGVTDEPGTTEEPNVTDPAVTGDPDPSDPSATSGGSGTTGDAGSTSGSTGTTLTNTAPAKINDQNGQNSGSASGGANSSQTEAAPRTGDTSAPILWIVLAVAAVAVIVGAVALKKTRK